MYKLQSIFLLLKLLLQSCYLLSVATHPTIGQLDKEQLETYEDLSLNLEDDFFNRLNLKFSCEDKSVGFYTDSSYNCRVFFLCDENGETIPIICPIDMIFNQRERICTSETEDVDCSNSDQWYFLNDAVHNSQELNVDVGDNLPNFEEEDYVPSVLPLLY